MNPWFDPLFEFFNDREEQIGHLLAARSCREGWLQGELYLRFAHEHAGFRVNAMPLGSKRGTADISCETRPKMIGEVKILGGGARHYQSKIVTGGSLSVIAGRLDTPVTHTDRGLSKGAWVRARLAEVIAELDRKKEHLLRSGVPKAMVPILLGVGISACESTSMPAYGAVCEGDDCGYPGGSGGTITATGGSGGVGGHEEGGAGGVGGSLGGAGGTGGNQGGADSGGGAGGT